MGVSPPQEMKIKVRQISRGVEDLNWRKNKSESPEGRPRNTQNDTDAPSTQATIQEDRDETGKPLNGSDREEDTETPPKSPADSQMSQSAPDVCQSAKVHANATTAPQITLSRHLRSDSESGDKGLKKRKYLERGASQGPQDSADSLKPPAEPTKRPRDDPDRDENPREKKRPSPPPEKSQAKVVTPSSSPKRVRHSRKSEGTLLIKGQKSFEASSLPKKVCHCTTLTERNFC